MCIGNKEKPYPDDPDGVVAYDASERLEYRNNRLYVGRWLPAIFIADSGIRIGCKSISAEAMDELCRTWTEFRTLLIRPLQLKVQ